MKLHARTTCVGQVSAEARALETQRALLLERNKPNLSIIDGAIFAPFKFAALLLIRDAPGSVFIQLPAPFRALNPPKTTADLRAENPNDDAVPDEGEHQEQEVNKR